MLLLHSPSEIIFTLPGLLEFVVIILRCCLLTSESLGIKKSSVLLYRVIKEEIGIAFF